MPTPFGHALAGLALGWAVAPSECRSVPSRPDRAEKDSTGVLAPDGARQQPGRHHGWATRLVRWRWPLTLAAAGMAADLDLLVGVHSRYSHSIGAVALVFGVAWLVLRGRTTRPAAVAFALALAYGSHILLDFLGSDTTPPLGIMALWPLSGGFYQSPVPLFLGISRRYWLVDTWIHIAAAMARELLLLVPLAALALWCRTTKRGSTSG